MLKLDVDTGDPIIPSAKLNYRSMLNNENINIWTYSIETVLAEKLETILSKIEVSSRMKDYYDIYLIFTRKWESINKENLRTAIEHTFSYRKFDKNLIQTLT